VRPAYPIELAVAILPCLSWPPENTAGPAAGRLNTSVRCRV